MNDEHEFDVEICRVSKEVTKIKAYGKSEDDAIKRAVAAARDGHGLFSPAGSPDVYCRHVAPVRSRP